MIIYHYTSGKGLFGIVDSDELHCSNVDFLNDSSEIKYFQKLVAFVIKNSKECEVIYSTLFNETFYNNVIVPTDTFVASFSKSDDSLPMWNYYAKGSGYSIGIDIDNLIEENRSEILSIQKVEMLYDQEKQLKDITELILNNKENYVMYQEFEEKSRTARNEIDHYEFTYKLDGLIEEFTYEFYKLGLGFKHKAYEQEQEVRLVISENQIEKNTNFKLSEAGTFIEYITVKLNGQSNIKSIKIHPLNNKLHLYGTKKFIASKYLNKKIEIKLSELPFRIV